MLKLRSCKSRVWGKNGRIYTRVHNTLQRVSNANYHCTNTLGKVTWLAREIYYALWRKRAVRIHIVVTIDRAIDPPSSSASSKSHGESAAAQDFCQDEILPEKRALLQSSNRDNVILCRAVVSRPRPHGQTAFCFLYFNYCWQYALSDLHSLCLTWVHVHTSSARRASAVALCAWRQWLETRQAIASSDHVFVTLLSRECLYSGNWRSILSVRYYVLLIYNIRVCLVIVAM